MCGRYGLEHAYADLAQRYQAVVATIDPGPRYNIAPTQPVAVVVPRAGERQLTHFYWGLIPFWAKDPSIGNRLINARAETAALLPAFRDPFVWRRCIVSASRFYEWQHLEDSKVPFTIARSDRAPMCFAGLWTYWRRRETDEWRRTCAIITTEAAPELSHIHSRMPVILEEDGALDVWLDQTVTDRAQLEAVLARPAGIELTACPITSLVNDYRNQGPKLLTPLFEKADIVAAA